MKSFIPDIGLYAVQFLISVGFAFLIGLEIYAKTPEENRKYLFGTERTFAFVALFGFVLLKSQTILPYAYIAGLIIVSVFLIIYYIQETKKSSHRGLTTILLCLLVYVLPLIIEQFPSWFSMLVIAVVMVLTEVKDKLKEFSKKIYTDEFLTLAKFVFLSGVILPLVPDREILTGIPVSPYKLWLAIVVISSISYLSYILRKFVFPNAGLLLAGILGGLYSSTATTFIISRKSREKEYVPNHYAAAILAATSLMFFRVYLLVFIFNPALSEVLLPWFFLLFAVTVTTSFIVYRIRPANSPKNDAVMHAKIQNPLELRLALIFGALYVLFSVLTQYTMQYYGQSGVRLLSFIVGFTDIDPFLLNIFQGKYPGLTNAVLVAAVFNAIVSNNLLKMIYATTLGDRSLRKYVLAGFSVIIALNLAIVFLLSAKPS